MQQKYQPWMKCFLFCPPLCMQLYTHFILNSSLNSRSNKCLLQALIINTSFPVWCPWQSPSEAAFLFFVSRLAGRWFQAWSVSLKKLTFEAAPFSGWQNLNQVTSCQSGKRNKWILRLAQGRLEAWQEPCWCRAELWRLTRGPPEGDLWRRDQL